MATSAKAGDRLASENLRVKAQVAQLADRLDCLTEGVCCSRSSEPQSMSDRQKEGT